MLFPGYGAAAARLGAERKAETGGGAQLVGKRAAAPGGRAEGAGGGLVRCERGSVS